ncbi:MAG: STAS domain-containing protein [Oscillospiraceae bacterium]|nr:STAS domain-containing protein [Oscillospiraceae bacterium]
MLNVVNTFENGTARVDLEGRLDTVTAPELEKQLKDAMDDAAELVLGMEKLDYISSAGLRVLLSAHKIMAGKGGALKLTGVSDIIMDIFDTTGFSEILNIE